MPPEVAIKSRPCRSRSRSSTSSAGSPCDLGQEARPPAGGFRQQQQAAVGADPAGGAVVSERLDRRRRREFAQRHRLGAAAGHPEEAAVGADPEGAAPSRVERPDGLRRQALGAADPPAGRPGGAVAAPAEPGVAGADPQGARRVFGQRGGEARGQALGSVGAPGGEGAFRQQQQALVHRAGPDLAAAVGVEIPGDRLPARSPAGSRSTRPSGRSRWMPPPKLANQTLPARSSAQRRDVVVGQAAGRAPDLEAAVPPAADAGMGGDPDAAAARRRHRADVVVGQAVALRQVQQRLARPVAEDPLPMVAIHKAPRRRPPGG